MKAVLVWLLLAIACGIAFMIKLVLEKEYGFWAAGVGDLLIRLASRCVPTSTRATRRHEWRAELEVLRQGGNPGLLFALRLLMRSPQTGLADRRNVAAADPLPDFDEIHKRVDIEAAALSAQFVSFTRALGTQPEAVRMKTLTTILRIVAESPETFVVGELSTDNWRLPSETPWTEIRLAADHDDEPAAD